MLGCAIAFLDIHSIPFLKKFKRIQSELNEFNLSRSLAGHRLIQTKSTGLPGMGDEGPHQQVRSLNWVIILKDYCGVNMHTEVGNRNSPLLALCQIP